MKIEATGAALLAAILLTASASAQAQAQAQAQTEQQRLNEAMRMQRATFNQNTAGNLDAAIEIYREIAGPRTADRALAAEAQYRLSQALLQKGDLTGSSEELLRLSTNFPDQAERISRLAGGSGPHAGGAPGPSVAELAELRKAQEESFAEIYGRELVPGGTQVLTTHVDGMSWTNPKSWLRVSDGATHWSLLLPAPNMLLWLGMTRESLPLGEQITVILTMDAGGTPLDDGSMLGRVESIVRLRDQVTVFDRATMPADAKQ